jgi:hypothetical protein
MSSVSPNFRRPPRFSEATLSSSTSDTARTSPGAGGWRYARALASCKTRSDEASLLHAIHVTDSYPYHGKLPLLKVGRNGIYAHFVPLWVRFCIVTR